MSGSVFPTQVFEDSSTFYLPKPLHSCNLKPCEVQTIFNWSRWCSPAAWWSGAGLRQGVEGPGDRLCVGEPGRLSLDDTDWCSPEEKLRLLCITVLCLDSFFRMLLRLVEMNVFIFTFSHLADAVIQSDLQ